MARDRVERRACRTCGHVSEWMPCDHPGLFPTFDAPQDHTGVMYKIWLDNTQLCGACHTNVPNREL